VIVILVHLDGRFQEKHAFKIYTVQLGTHQFAFHVNLAITLELEEFALSLIFTVLALTQQMAIAIFVNLDGKPEELHVLLNPSSILIASLGVHAMLVNLDITLIHLEFVL
jgi:hypothetical protein